MLWIVVASVAAASIQFQSKVGAIVPVSSPGEWVPIQNQAVTTCSYCRTKSALKNCNCPNCGAPKEN